MKSLNSRQMQIVFSWALILSVLLSSCAAVQTAGVPPQLVQGEVMLLHPGSTWWGMMQALEGAAGTLRMMKDGQLVLGWVQPGLGSAYAYISEPTRMGMQNFLWQWGGKAQIVTGCDWQCLQSTLQSVGWKLVPAGAVPTEFMVELASAAAGFILVSTGLPNVIMLPAGLFDAPLNMKPPSVMN
mgnify:CR=1 FL=1